MTKQTIEGVLEALKEQVRTARQERDDARTVARRLYILLGLIEGEESMPDVPDWVKEG